MQQINCNAMVSNAHYFRQRIGLCKLCAVVKNNAYGHGLVQTASALVNHVDMFAVGSGNECAQIAHLGKPVLVLLPLQADDCYAALQRGAILTLDSFETLQTINKVASAIGIVASVHVKIDSGMSRLGFTLDQLPQLLDKLKNSNVHVDGVFSHFLGRDAMQCDKQFDYFVKCVSVVEQLYPKVVRHIANTAGTLLCPTYHLDMVRVGIGLYGYGCNGLLPAKRVTATVVAIKQVPKGSVVGYDAKFVCSKATNLAIINVGYADGFCRSLCGVRVFVGGAPCKVVAICMAMSIVDLQNCSAHVGDSVTILGNDTNVGNNCVNAYELLCNLQ